MHCQKSDPNPQKFCNILEEFNLKQHVQEPTHFHGHTLDVLITNNCSDIVSQVKVLDPFFSTDDGQLIRDHYIVSWEYKGD